MKPRKKNRERFDEMIFEDTLVLLFLPLLFLFIYLLKKKSILSSIRFSSAEPMKGYKPTIKVSLSKNLIYLRTAAIALILIALARPQMPLKETKDRNRGHRYCFGCGLFRQYAG